MGTNGPFDDPTDEPRKPGEQPEPEDQNDQGDDVDAITTAGARTKGGAPVAPGDDLFGEPSKEKTAKRGSVSKSVTRSFQNIKQAAKSNPKKFKTITIVGVVVVLLAVLAIGILQETSKRKPQETKQDLSGKLRVAEDVSKDITEFMQRAETERRTFTDTIEDNRKALENLTKQISKQDERMARLEAAHKEEVAELNRRIEASRRGGSDFVFVGDPNRKGTSPAQSAGFDEAMTALVNTMRQARTGGQMTLGEARLRASRFAEEQGYKGEDALFLRDRILDRVGFLQVGQVAESAMSPDEVAGLDPMLRPLATKARDYQLQMGQVEGKVIPRPEEMRTFVTAELGEPASKGISDEAVQQFAITTRVRLANVPEAMELKLPALMAEREARGIKIEDILGLERLVWDKRGELGAMQPGQHLALVWAMARGDRSGSSAQVTSSLTPATAAEIDLAKAAGERAVTTALQQGIRGAADLRARARTAIDRSLETQRRTVADAERDRLAQAAVLSAVRGSSEAGSGPSLPGPAVPESAGPAVAATGPAAHEPEPVIYFGNLTLHRASAGRAAWSLVPYVIERVGLDATTPEGIAATAVLWTAAPGIGERAFDAAADQPLAARVWSDEVFRAMADHASQASFLNRIQIQPYQGEDAAQLGAAYYGSLLGPVLLDKERGGGAYQAAVERARRGKPFSAAALASYRALEPSKPWARTATLVRDLVPQALPDQPERIQEVQEHLMQWMADRQVAIAQIGSHERLAPDVRQKLAREVSDHLPTISSMILGQVDDGRLPLDALKAVYKEQSTLFAALSVAHAQLLDQVVGRVVLPYASAMDQNTGGISRLVNSIQTWAPEAILERYQRLRPAINDSTYIAVAIDLAEGLLGDAERVIVRELLLSRVEPRIERAAKGFPPVALKDAMATVRSRAGELVADATLPTSQNELDRLAIILTRAGMDALEARRPAEPASPGRSGQPTKGARDQQARGPLPAIVPVKEFPLPGGPVGAARTSGRASGKSRVIPAFSFADATLMNGQSVEVGGNANEEAVFECAPRWDGPGGSSVTMPRLRVGGRVEANVGGSRLRVEVRKLAYVFPNNRTIERPVRGFVVDNLEGKTGMLAEWRTNWEKIVPPAAAVAALSGTEAALDDSQQQVSVTTGGTTTVNTNTTSTAQRALMGAASEGGQIVEDFFRTFLDAVKPTVEAPNGQPVTVVLVDTVVFDDVTDAEWQSAMGLSPHAGF